MRFTAQEEYGLRCVLQMAKRDGEGPMKITDLAELEGLTTAYVAKLMRVLRKGEIVVSVRGQAGGYRLARPPALMSVADVLMVLDHRLYEPAYCNQYTGTVRSCVHISDCSIRALWRRLEASLWLVLDKATLADLIGHEKETIIQLGATLHAAKAS